MTNINRLPTKAETFAGAAVSLVLSIALGFVISFMFWAAFRNGKIVDAPYIIILAVVSLIFSWTSALFFRIVLGTPQKPSFKGQRAIGYGLALLGALLCFLPFLHLGKVPDQLPYQGVVGVVLGLSWAYQAGKDERG